MEPWLKKNDRILVLLSLGIFPYTGYFIWYLRLNEDRSDDKIIGQYSQKHESNLAVDAIRL